MNNFAISGGHDLTIGAAKEILLNGGNAIDAAIAAYAVCFIAEPCMASIGAGGFANIYSKEHESIIVDFFCQTPRHKNLDNISFFPIEVDFGVASEEFYIGLGSAATPGAIAGIFSMHEMFGTMPLSELFYPAIKLAKEGIEINDFQHYDLELLKEIFTQDEKSKEIFFENGEVKEVGKKTFMPQFADFMESLAIEGSDLFYKGEIAASVSNDCAEFGGFLTYEDFENYQVKLRDSIRFKFADHQIIVPGYPSFGGGLMALYLNELDKLSRDTEYLGKAHLDHLLDAGIFVNPFKHNPKALDAAVRNLGIRLPTSYDQNTFSPGGTSHFNIVDKDKNAVSLTTSIGEGSGYMIKGTDMMLNNMLGEKALLPHGLHSWVPDSRLYSMMTPSIVVDEDKMLKMVLGSGGAGRIPFMISQVIANNLIFDKDLHVAVNSPRVYYGHDVFNIEKGFQDQFLENKKDLNYKRWDHSLFFGGVHGIYTAKDNYDAEGDQRRDGVSIIK